jgi:hypothetical protein
VEQKVCHKVAVTDLLFPIARPHRVETKVWDKAGVPDLPFPNRLKADDAKVGMCP